MQKYYSSHRRKIYIRISLLWVTLALVFACNKPFPDTLDTGRSMSDYNAIQRKAILIIVDGAVGDEVNAMSPPNLTLIADYALYSMNSLNEYKDIPITNELSWTTLLTGVTSEKHKVTGSDFTGSKLAEYPSIFTRLKTIKPTFRSVAYCSSAEVTDNLAIDASEKKTFADNDEGVKNAVVTELSANNPDFILAQFHNVDKVGAEKGYTRRVPEYRNAVLQVDAYIGEILDALEKRNSTNNNEDWAVIVASNKGSNTPYVPIGKVWSAFDDTRHNTMFLYYNPRFKSLNLMPPSMPPYTGLTPFYSGTQANNQRAKVLDGGTTYDIGDNGSFTIQCKVKMPAGVNVNYPSFLAKRASFTGGVVGWCFFREGAYWQINFGQSGKNNIQQRGHDIADGKWHTLTAVIKQEGAARNVYVYTDGVIYTTSPRDISSLGNLNSPAPLTVGNLPPDNNTTLTDYMVTDIRIYNTALSDSYIRTNYCQTSLADDDPYKSNLLGFWPSTDVEPDNSILDMSGNGHSLVIEKYKPSSFSEITASICPALTGEAYKIVPNSSDATVLIFNWLNIKVPHEWQLDGKIWTPEFVDVGRNN